MCSDKPARLYYMAPLEEKQPDKAGGDDYIDE